VEYQQILAATERQFVEEERDIEARQAELDTAQALLDRRRKALKRKRSGFGRMLEGWRTLDAEVVSGKPARSDAADDDQDGDERREPADGEAAA
jgi:multidrug efflux pump subunit AcrA (membrane-fusion protein)